MRKTRLSFIVPVNKEDVLRRNVLASKVYRDGHHQFIFQRGYTNVAKAYNDAVPAADNDILVFCHQDVYFPDEWEEQFLESLSQVNKQDPDWGVLGVAGVSLVQRPLGLGPGIEFVGNFSTNVAGGAHIIDYYRPKSYPQVVHTLDEFILVVKKSNAIFDEQIPNNHFYGADLCLHCATEGKRSYAISAYMHHDSMLTWVSSDFFGSAAYMYSKYKNVLPIATTCTVIEDVDGKPKFHTDFIAVTLMTLHSFFSFRRRAPRPHKKSRLV